VQPAIAIRLDFEYRGRDIQLVNHVRLAMRTPPSDDAASDDRSGLWVDVRDRDGRALFRRALHDVRFRIEVPSTADGAFTNVYDPQATGAFSVFVPALDAGERVMLFAGDADGERAKPVLTVSFATLA
jgi:hypothetical protein